MKARMDFGIGAPETTCGAPSSTKRSRCCAPTKNSSSEWVMSYVSGFPVSQSFGPGCVSGTLWM